MRVANLLLLLQTALLDVAVQTAFSDVTGAFLDTFSGFTKETSFFSGNFSKKLSWAALPAAFRSFVEEQFTWPLVSSLAPQFQQIGSTKSELIFLL